MADVTRGRPRSPEVTRDHPRLAWQAPRKLVWKPSLGTVTLDVIFPRRQRVRAVRLVSAQPGACIGHFPRRQRRRRAVQAAASDDPAPVRRAAEMGAGGFGVRARRRCRHARRVSPAALFDARRGSSSRHRHRRGSQEPLDLAQPRLHLRGAVSAQSRRNLGERSLPMPPLPSFPPAASRRGGGSRRALPWLTPRPPCSGERRGRRRLVINSNARI